MTYMDVKELIKSLNTICCNLENYDIACISATRKFRDYNKIETVGSEKGFTEGEKKERSKILEAKILISKNAFTTFCGKYLKISEKKGESSFDDDTLFVVNIGHNTNFFETIMNLGIEFSQQSILLKPNGGDGYHYERSDLSPVYNVLRPARDFAVGKADEFLLGVKSHPITFDHFYFHGNMGKYVISKTAKKEV